MYIYIYYTKYDPSVRPQIDFVKVKKSRGHFLRYTNCQESVCGSVKHMNSRTHAPQLVEVNP